MRRKPFLVASLLLAVSAFSQLDLSAAAQYEDVIRGLMTNVANNSHRPQLKSDSFFRRYSETPSQH